MTSLFIFLQWNLEFCPAESQLIGIVQSYVVFSLHSEEIIISIHKLLPSAHEVGWLVLTSPTLWTYISKYLLSISTWMSKDTLKLTLRTEVWILLPVPHGDFPQEPSLQ